MQRRLVVRVAAWPAVSAAARHELQRLAMSDPLTGLANRRAIMGALVSALEAASRDATTLGVLLCDIDHFKRINDLFGHLAGDVVLVEFARRLVEATPAPALVGRYGGEEFLLVLPLDEETVIRVADVVRAAVAREPFLIGETERAVTTSAGLAFLREGDTLITLIARADAALYRAKARGRDRIDCDDGRELAGLTDPRPCPEPPGCRTDEPSALFACD